MGLTMLGIQTPSTRLDRYRTDPADPRLRQRKCSSGTKAGDFGVPELGDQEQIKSKLDRSFFSSIISKVVRSYLPYWDNPVLSLDDGASVPEPQFDHLKHARGLYVLLLAKNMESTGFRRICISLRRIYSITYLDILKAQSSDIRSVPSHHTALHQ